MTGCRPLPKQTTSRQSVVAPIRATRCPNLSPDVAGCGDLWWAPIGGRCASLPLLTDEMAFIEKVLAADLPTLGICLGAQLIIRVLGGQVGPLNGNLHEFGYYPVIPHCRGPRFPARHPACDRSALSYLHPAGRGDAAGIGRRHMPIRHSAMATRYMACSSIPNAPPTSSAAGNSRNMPLTASPARKAAKNKTA